jgi:hypothetical protein
MVKIKTHGGMIQIAEKRFPVGSLIADFVGERIFVYMLGVFSVPILYNIKYSDITDPETNAAFANIQALKDWVDTNFFFDVVRERVVDTYADMEALLVKDSPATPVRYFVKSDETNGGVSASYTHYNNQLTVVIETES